jgi:hypothetical protein
MFQNFVMSFRLLGFRVKSDGIKVKCHLYPCKTNKNTKLPLIKKLKIKIKIRVKYLTGTCG